MVLGVISNEGHVMLPHFFEQGHRVNAAAYIDILASLFFLGSRVLRKGGRMSSNKTLLLPIRRTLRKNGFRTIFMTM